MREFNTAGPIIPEDHYHIAPLARLDRDELLRLIERKKYFVLHAPRQTGKTTILRALRDELNGSGQYRCVYVDVETAQSAREDVGAAMQAILGALSRQERTGLGESYLRGVWREALAEVGPHEALQEVLGRWAESEARPLVLLIDEIDALIGDSLLSVLRQLRAGYPDRPRRYPQSVILCGVRDVRDHRIRSRAENALVAGGSAFNVKAESLRLGDLSQEQVRALLAQHTSETGQAWTYAALREVWDATRGQPWLVNALAYEACFRNRAGRDRERPITVEAIRDAREQLVLRRETHLDRLALHLEEDRVRRVVGPLLSGDPEAAAVPADDIEYVRDLGLVAADGPLAIANPIYREVIPRELTRSTQEMLAQDPNWYVGPDGDLLVGDLLAAFQHFFREHSEHWVAGLQYKEAGPQLLLQAFLQRIVNSGGRVEREYGLGRMRTDLLIVWPARGAQGDPRGVTKTVVECKLVHGSLEATVRAGLEQTRAYMDRCTAAAGHLVVFDRASGKSWDEKVFRREKAVAGTRVTVWGM